MNYERIYESIVARGKERVTVEGYSERHHIIPRCLGGSDDEENLVALTAEEHYVVHQLLVKMHPGHFGLVHAAKMMCTNRFGHRGNNKLYSWLKKRVKHTEETKRKIGAANTKSHVKKICRGCGCTIEATEIAAKTKVWCSRECQDSSGRSNHTCIQCSSTFNAPKHKMRKYCSHDCVWAFKRTHKIF